MTKRSLATFEWMNARNAQSEGRIPLRQPRHRSLGRELLFFIDSLEEIVGIVMEATMNAK